MIFTQLNCRFNPKVKMIHGIFFLAFSLAIYLGEWKIKSIESWSNYYAPSVKNNKKKMRPNFSFSFLVIYFIEELTQLSTYQLIFASLSIADFSTKNIKIENNLYKMMIILNWRNFQVHK